MALYGFILIMCALVAYGVYSFSRYIIKNNATKQTASSDEKHKIRSTLIEKIYVKAHTGTEKTISKNPVSKVTLMEEMNLKPHELKHYLYMLTSHNIAEEQQDTVTITPFGIEFYNVFGKEGGWRA